MRLRQLLLSALAMVAATTGYAQDISSIVTAEQGITVYDYNNDWTISSRISYYDNGVPDQENSYTIYFESESEIEVSFDIDVVTDDNAYLHISFSDGTETSIDYADGKHITHSFEAGENNIYFTYSRWDYMVSDEWGPTVMDQRAEVYNIIVKGLCAHEFPEESTYPATCTEPSMSECIKCGKLLNDNHSAALGHDFDDNGKCQREGCGLVDARIKVLSSDFVSISVADNEYPWEYFESEEDGTRGLRSTNQGQDNTSSETSITMSCADFDYRISFECKVSSEYNYDCFYIYVDDNEERKYSYNESGTFSKEFEKGTAHTIKLVYKKDRSTSVDEDRAWINSIKIETICKHNFDADGKCTICGYVYVDNRSQIFAVDGVEVSFEDNEYAWEAEEISGGSMRMKSTNQDKDETESKTTITLTSEYEFMISFDYKVSSEGYCDYLNITVDNVPICENLSGEANNSYEGGYAKAHTIVLSYKKDYSRKERLDTGYISNIKVRTKLDTTDDGLIEVEDIVMGINMLGSGNLTEEQLNEIIEFILHKE